MASKKALDLKVEGLEDVVGALQRFGLDVQDSLEAIFLAAIEPIQQGIEGKAPGSLGDDVPIETLKKGKKNVVVATGPSKRKPHAHLIEFGVSAHSTAATDAEALRFEDGEFRRKVEHPGFGAMPFVRPAFDANKDRALEQSRQGMKKVVDRAGKGTV